LAENIEAAGCKADETVLHSDGRPLKVQHIAITSVLKKITEMLSDLPPYVVL